ncbi:hypothetical protein [Hyalangium minutum]|uniref:Transporter n=1 Tax=Hyalangium minutum TaxID=394096 RepID=A0A085W5R1_9BACT|nr:hypothetical protein [Hyalangium minutum]KFE63024.1 hypothetical protein DB31_3083 [Hyalangium minutum]
MESSTRTTVPLTRAALLLLGLWLPTPVLAQTAPPLPERRLVINSLLVARLNPLGLELQTRGGYQRRLYPHEGPLFRDNFLFVGVYPKLSPAGIKVGPVVEVQPLSIFNLRLSAEYVGFFGAQGFLQSRPSANADASDTARDDGKAAGQHYSASGMRLALEPFVQMKLGPVAVRNRFAAEYWSMGLRGEDRVWYDATLDTLVPGKGFTLANDLDVLFLGLPPLVVGARYSLVEPLYTPRHLEAGEALTVDNGHQRVGLLAAYVFYDEGYTAFNKPAVILNVAWYLQHRFRTGADVNRAMPYLLLGFAFQSDLLDGT